jgi:hypothetical protein
VSHRNIVVEIQPDVPDTAAESAIGQSKGNGEVGVVIKATQGSRWRRTDVDTLFDHAESCEVFKGWLHYCEPGAGDAESEAAWLMSSLGSRPLELGIWLELDDLGGLPAQEAGPWLDTLVKAVSTPARPACLVVDPDVVSGLGVLPPGLRLVLTKSTELMVGAPWAVRDPEPIDCGDGTTLATYELTSTRGLVPAAPVAAPVAPGGTAGSPSAPGAPEGSGGILKPPEGDEELEDTEHDPDADEELLEPESQLAKP